MRKAKIEEIELLRALAFLAVVVQHAIAHYTFDPGMTPADGVAIGLLLLAVKFAVPLFVFITGLVLFYNYDGPLRYGDFVWKRFRDIIVPYLVWTGFYFLMYHVWNHPDVSAVWEFVRLAVTGKASYHLWYVVMIFQFYLLFPLLRRAFVWLRGLLKARWQVYAVLTLSAGLYVYLMTLVWPLNVLMEAWNVPVLTPLFTKFADRNALYFVYYFAMGAVTGLALTHWRAFLTKYRTAIWAVFAGMFAYFAYRVIGMYQYEPAFRVNFDYLFLLRPWMAVFLIVSILALYLLAMRVGTSRWAAVIGRYSFGAYLMHAYVLRQTYFLTDGLLAGYNVTLRTVIAALLCAAVSILATMLLAKTPLGKVVVGVRDK
ncbi:surface polysaccharide O-acyltransferase-like enzyme [Tumebacillus sp. BK434]|uniref:acyltransferase n=1 Tax=Tumebacillus sp. BK434 TaxID=2512169 RepID=UPI00104BEF9B|nr:acyltransferase [Tumebacillus sp. BK434]TCP52689.1 surface polysaccharide O-acyltransferase-like enzyme [Tumebacillus sp. BK434]